MRKGDKDKYLNVSPEAVLDDYYANKGEFDWHKEKTSKSSGPPGPWAMTTHAICKKYGFKSTPSVLDRVRKLGVGTRTQISTRFGLRPNRGGSGVRGGENGAGSLPLAGRQYQLARNVASAFLLKSALTSPKVMLLLHEVVKDLARAMGVPAPTAQEVSKYLGELR